VTVKNRYNVLVSQASFRIRESSDSARYGPLTCFPAISAALLTNQTQNPTRGDRGSQSGDSRNNPQAINSPHISEEQLAVLSHAAEIIGVSVETLTSLRPNHTPDAAFCLQNNLQSIDQYGDVENSSIRQAISVSHHTQPLYPQDSMEISDLQQLQDFAVLFGNDSRYVDTDYLQTFTDISPSNSTNIDSMNTYDVLATDGMALSPPFVDSDRNQTATSQGQSLTGENLTPSLQSDSVGNEHADHDWLWIRDSLELHGSTNDVNTTSGTDFGGSPERIDTSPSEVSGSSSAIPTPPTPSSVDDQNRSLKPLLPSTNQENIRVSLAEKYLAEKSTPTSTSMSTATSSNLSTFGPTREWILPKRVSLLQD
jgi:hypothetical protein